jgi:hypothetical protein
MPRKDPLVLVSRRLLLNTLIWSLMGKKGLQQIKSSHNGLYCSHLSRSGIFHQTAPQTNRFLLA